VTGALPAGESPWRLSWCADPAVAALITGHYSRQTPDAAQFMPPGRKLVLKTGGARAAWGTSWPDTQYVHRAWPGAWLNSLFCRRGDPALASDLIRWAVAHTRATWPGQPPDDGFITMVDPASVATGDQAGRAAVGWCYRKAGWRHAGWTSYRNLMVFRLDPEDMQPPVPVPGAPEPLFPAEGH
jgi:hypothetical protein